MRNHWTLGIVFVACIAAILWLYTTAGILVAAVPGVIAIFVAIRLFPWSWLPYIWGLLWGIDLRYDESIATKSAINEAIVLYTLIVTQGIALTLADRRTERDLHVSLTLYAIIALGTLGAFVGILRAHPTDSKRSFHVYERGSIVFTRCAFVFSLAIALLFGYFAWAKILPGEPPSVELRVLDPGPYQFEYDRDVVGIEFYTQIRPSDFDHLGYPRSVVLGFTFDKAVNATHRLSDVEGHYLAPRDGDDGGTPEEEKQPMDNQPSLTSDDEYKRGKTNTTTVFLSDVNVARTCSLRLLLHPRSSDPDMKSDVVIRDELLSKIKEGRLIRITMRAPRG